MQLRANRLKRKYIFKKYKKSLKIQKVMDSRESSDLSPIKIPNKITNPENKR